MYLESDVIKLAAAAEGGSAWMDDAVGLTDGHRAFPRLPARLPGRATCGRRTGGGSPLDAFFTGHNS